MEIFRREHRVGPEGLSTQQLFKLLQDSAGDQCVPLHLSGPDLEKKGLMWVIIKYRVSVTRWPQPGESFTLNTWPGRTRHGMMPRFYTLKTADGALLLAVSSVWAVVDRKTRSMVNNADFGVTLEAIETGEEIRRYCRDNMPHFQVPREVEILPALPKNPSGKVLIQELKHRAQP